ncbi:MULTISPECIES: sporulation membrane protein YtrI [Bacillaceae]|uniref:sporulation membrane protein YtrI n=1 Tax=Bacillaceae TaxID=186817 RepID=UPI000BFE5394|nr:MULTISPECIES: sporulation membrane protein YtrI [Bacillaceae]MCM3162846.1 sporulation protein [Metabacillus litoralis]MCM3411012.1 sporulation protein [Metabacillus litoralis]PGT91225.1 sporulation protein [Bacillus sp. AFS040349]UGB29785.1 sporulation protein [Metabacillus sp. B2-18]UHA62238.1 sporulation protein [Metabacillus litoralis]
MRIPPHYQQPSWQRFFAGAAIGAVISWGVFLFIFGVIQEEHSTIINKQKQTIQDLENDKKIYQEEYTKLNKKAQEKLTVQEIKIKLTNGDRYLFKDFRITNIENSVKEDLKDVMAKDIESIVSNHLLIERIIENKPLKFDGKEYKLEMTKFMLTTTLYIEVKISFVD